MISIYDQAGMEKLRSRTAVQPHAMKKFLNAFFKKGLGAEGALVTLPEVARPVFEEAVEFDVLELKERHDSKVDGASKLIFRTHDGHFIETVILRVKSGRTSLCISSQIGCVCQCGFCATGSMGFARDLTYAEILDQVAQADRLLRTEGRCVRNVVFMGMGEPLLNPENVHRAIELLQSVPHFNYSAARIMVSTVGIVPEMIRFKERFPETQLALSLHSARQDVREKLMPLGRKYDLGHLHEALAALDGQGKVMIEYLMLKGLNDTPEDLAALIDYLRDIPAHINIIPFNAYDGCDLEGTDRPEREAFANALKAEGFDVTLRYSLGMDIAAACGQLVQQKKKQRGLNVTE